ncbi:MAG TPA: hypothetical protein DCM62_05130 [Bacteroidales bacterium]|nr:hypothetical protein [Bacteroidales bacterium]
MIGFNCRLNSKSLNFGVCLFLPDLLAFISKANEELPLKTIQPNWLSFRKKLTDLKSNNKLQCDSF